MIQRGEDAGLSLERFGRQFANLGIGRKLHHFFDGAQAGHRWKVHVAGLINGAEAAYSQRTDDPVATLQHRSGLELFSLAVFWLPETFTDKLSGC